MPTLHFSFESNIDGSLALVFVALSNLNKTVSMKDKRFKAPQENKYPLQKNLSNTTEKGMHFMQYGHTNPTLPPSSYLHVNWTGHRPISVMH